MLHEDSISHLLTSTQLAEESNALTVLPIRNGCLETLHQHYVMTNELQSNVTVEQCLDINPYKSINQSILIRSSILSL